MANYQQKRYILMKFFHSEKHIVFSDVGKGRRMKEIYDGLWQWLYSIKLRVKSNFYIDIYRLPIYTICR